MIWDGREFPLREGISVIGRADDADVRIPLPSLSRHHARIVVRGLDATIEDLGSRHGSWRGTVRGEATDAGSRAATKSGSARRRWSIASSCRMTRRDG